MSTSAGLFAFISLVFIGVDGWGQVLQTARYELPVHHQEKNIEIIPAGTSGLFLYRHYAGRIEDQVQLIRVDTSFQQQWAGFLNVEKNYLIMGKRTFRNKLYLLLRYRDYTRNDLILYAIDEKDGGYQRFHIRGFIPFSPSEFHLTANAAIIGGYYNRVPVVLHFSFETRKSKVLPGLFNETGELTQVKTYDDGSFDVLISALNYARQRTLWIKNYDPEGNLYRNFALKPDEGKHLIFGRSIKTADNMQIVAGVYGNRSAEFSRGLFIARVDPSGLEDIRYYNFADLENFFKYMRAKREMRVKSRIERKKIKGKRIRFNYRFLVHELVPYNGNFVLLGEAFYPKYIDAPRGYGSAFFSPWSLPVGMVRNGRIFDGYHYTHAIVLGFNAAGDLQWDNSFEINDVRTFTLEQFVKLDTDADKIVLFYLFDNHIRTKIIQGDQVLEGKTVDPISTLNERDIVRKDRKESSKLEYWYGENLYACGVQEIGNTGGGQRRVFYINKVRFAR